MESDQRLDGQPSMWPEALLDRVAALDFCDGYLVLVGDPATGEVDAHGPYAGLDATVAADHVRQDLDLFGLDNVHVSVVGLHHRQGSA